MKPILTAITIVFFICSQATAQQKLTLAQQQEDFSIFKGGLNEGHSGLYYFIDKKTFEKECDSIQKTFKEGAAIEDYYLKLRFIIASLHHGHTRISLPTSGNVNYKMAVLDTSKLYLPFQFVIIKDKLVILEDCSKEQLIPKYAVVKSINGESPKNLIGKMLPYIAADGINQTFKYYSLYNYFYFHHLFNLFYQEKKGVKIEIESSQTHFYIELLKAKTIDSIYFAKNKKSISQYDKQLEYKPSLPKQTAYLRISSFYKGLIENFGQHYESFIDSSFTDIRLKGLENLILDVRDNEGGGDGFDNILLAYLINKKSDSGGSIKVPGRNFQYNKYAINLTDDVKGFIENPQEFLRDDTSLYIKDKYVDMMKEGNINPPKNNFNGKIIVLINGGSFSATNAVISNLYTNRNNTGRQIVFVGEENGGDIYCGSGCAGQGYTIKLPNSSIQVDMPFLCFGELKKNYPKKRLPDYEVYESVKSLMSGKDDVLQFALENTDKITKPFVKSKK